MVAELSADHVPDFVWKMRHLILGYTKSLAMMRTNHRKWNRSQHEFSSFPTNSIEEMRNAHSSQYAAISEKIVET